MPTWVYAILWRSSFIYTSALIRNSCNHNSHHTHDYQSHSARPYKQRKAPTSEHSGVITLRTLILAPPRGDDIYISFSYYFCMIFSIPTGIYDWAGRWERWERWVTMQRRLTLRPHYSHCNPFCYPLAAPASELPFLLPFRAYWSKLVHKIGAIDWFLYICTICVRNG